MTDTIAPPGQVWVCAACGKRSRDRYGFQRISPGWDESCMLNALLCHENGLIFGAGGRVAKIDEGGVVEPQPE